MGSPAPPPAAGTRAASRAGEVGRSVRHGGHVAPRRVAGNTARPPPFQRFSLAPQHDGLRRLQILFKGSQHRPVRVGHLREPGPGGGKGAFGRFQVSGLAEQMAEASEPGRGDAVSGRQGIVRERLAAVHELLVVVGGEPEAAPLAVLEAFEEGIRESEREVEICRPPAGLEEPEGSFEQECVVVEIGGEAGAAVLPGGEEPALDPGVPAEEIERPRRRVHEAGLPEGLSGDREAGHHHRVPGGEHLVVESGAHPRGARLEQLGACAVEPPGGGGRVHPELRSERLALHEGVQMPGVALEVGWAVHPERDGRRRELVLVQHRPRRIRRPEIEAALRALRVGVEGGVEPARRRLHLPDRPTPRLAGGSCEERLVPPRRSALLARTERGAAHCRRASSRSGGSSTPRPPSSGRTHRPDGRRSPPRDILARVCRPMCRSRGSRWRRKHRSTLVGWGNFGAPPKPPSRASKARRRPAIARSSGSGPMAAAPPSSAPPGSARARAARSDSFCFAISSPWVARKSTMRSSRSRNAGSPWRGAGGK